MSDAKISRWKNVFSVIDQRNQTENWCHKSLHDRGSPEIVSGSQMNAFDVETTRMEAFDEGKIQVSAPTKLRAQSRNPPTSKRHDTYWSSDKEKKLWDILKITSEAQKHRLQGWIGAKIHLILEPGAISSWFRTPNRSWQFFLFDSTKSNHGKWPLEISISKISMS